MTIADSLNDLARRVATDPFNKVIPTASPTPRAETWVSVGVDHDTAELAVATLERWWREMGYLPARRAARIDPIVALNQRCAVHVAVHAQPEGNG